jgi:hypothetical protein
MVSQCANPKCSKPLVYLREGRIFIFDMPATPAAGTASSGRGSHRLEHFWLCGDCCRIMVLHQNGEGDLELVPRNVQEVNLRGREADKQRTAIAS